MSAFIEQRKALGFAVALTCRSIGTSPSAYYQRATGALSTRAIEDERLLVQIGRVYRANYEAYGSLRVWKALRREGIMVGRGRVQRLMAQDGLVGAKRRGRAWKTTIADPAGCELRDALRLEIPEAKLPDPTLARYFSHGAEVAAGRWDHFERPGRETLQDFRGTKHAHDLPRRERPLNLCRRVYLCGAEQCRVSGDGWKRPPLFGRQPVEQA